MSATTIKEHELEQVDRANKTGLRPVVFVHGLWLLPSSWDRWAAVFEKAGFTALTPGWPDDPDTVAEANTNPEVFAHKTIGQVADHFAEIIAALERKPAIIGHSFGGLLVQILAGRGLSAAAVAIDPAPFRGVLPLPVSSLKSAWPVLGNPANRNRAIPLTFDQFRFGFATAAEHYWSPNYIQHSAHIARGRDGLFNLIKSIPPTLKYEPGTIVAEGDFVIVHGRFSGFGQPVNWIAADIVRIQDGILVEHWDVIQDEATEEQSKSGQPMFGSTFAT